MRLLFLAVGLGLAPALIGATTAQGASRAVLTSKHGVIPVQWEMTQGDKFAVIFLTAKDAEAQKVSISLISITHEGGIAFPREALRFDTEPVGNISIGAVKPVRVIPDPTMLTRPGKYTAQILLSAENAEAKIENLTLLRTEPVLEAYPNPFKVTLTRTFPLPIRQDPINAKRQISIRETGLLAGIRDIAHQAGPLLFAEGGGAVPGEIKLELDKSSIGPGGQVALFATIRGITRTGKFASKIHLQSSYLKQPLTISVEATVTDFWIFPLLAIGVGVWLSYWVSTWTGRRRGLALERSLIQLENEVDARVPAGHSDRPGLMDLLSSARRQLDRGDLDGAKKSLDEGERRYHEIVVPPVRQVHVAGAMRYATAATAAAELAATPAIVCDDPQDAWDQDRNLSFRIINPPAPWGDATMYVWNFGDETPPHKVTGPQGQTADHRFTTPGRYQVSLSADPDPTGPTPLYYPVEIKASRVDTLERQLARGDKLLTRLTLALATGTGLLAVYFTGKPFGSVADYIGALIWGFGIDKSVQGLASVRARITGGDGR